MINLERYRKPIDEYIKNINTDDFIISDSGKVSRSLNSIVKSDSGKRQLAAIKEIRLDTYIIV